MAHQAEPVLDEIVWRSPVIFQAWGGLNPNTVLLYFRESPFFDRTSNNNTIWTQAFYNPSMLPLLESREALEARLRTMTGLEFVVAKMAPENGLYVIRKQYRRGRRLPKYDLGEMPDGNPADGKVEDVRVEELYFVVGENIYQAPQVGAVLAARMLSITSHIKNALAKSASLSNFSPSFGHHYLPPTTATGPQNATQKSNPPTQPTSQIATPSQSINTSINKNFISMSQSSASASLAQLTKSQIEPTNAIQEIATMPASLRLSLRHANEYMDTPPPPETQPSQANTYSTNPSQQSSQQRAGDSQNKAVAVVAGAGGTVGKGPAAVPNAVPAAAPAPAAPPKRRRKSKAAGLVSPT